MERQHLGLLLGFAVGSLALWWLRSPAEPAARSASADSASAGPELARPLPPPKTNPRYPGSLDLFVDSNRKGAQGLSETGDSTPRINATARTPMLKDAAPQAQGPEAAQAALAARSPSAERRPEVAYLAFLRAVGLGASLVGFLAWLSASRGLSWLSVAAALALAVLAVLIRARVAASEPLAWAGLAAFMGSAAASRIRAR